MTDRRHFQSEHIAPVLSIIPALNNSVIVSGGEDSRIIITSLLTGDVVMKIDHHRGPVTAVTVNATGDVLVSVGEYRRSAEEGSEELLKSANEIAKALKLELRLPRTSSRQQYRANHPASSLSEYFRRSLYVPYEFVIILIRGENFNLLNSINLPSGINLLDVSNDSVFLLAACEDNQLYLHSLATGTEIHILRGHKAEVKSLCLAQDNCRAVVGGSDGKIYLFDMHSGRIDRTLTSHSTEVTGVKVTNKDDFLLTAGGNRITFWSFRRDGSTAVSEIEGLLLDKTDSRTTSSQYVQHHTAAITCLDISRDGTMAVTVIAWVVNETNTTTRILSTRKHKVSFELTRKQGFEPCSTLVFLRALDKTFLSKSHTDTLTAVAVMIDSRRVVSSDRQGGLAIWLADNASILQSCLRICSVSREEVRHTVSHSEEVTCFVLTMDSQHLITGSRDMSLKVWQVDGGKLAQVLVGHTDHVTCVAVAILNKCLVVSGSRDSNLIVWDINTGNDMHVLRGHLGYITCVKVAGDGSLAVSGSEDKSIIVWDTKRGQVISSIQLQIPILNLEMSTDASRITVLLLENKCLPIVCLHNTTATYVKMPTYVAPTKEIEDLRPSVPKRPMRRLLKKEVSLDTYTWQKKYGHLTSSIMMAAVDERLKRRFSVSASMEEISKIPSKGNMGSQPINGKISEPRGIVVIAPSYEPRGPGFDSRLVPWGIGPEQAALAQSQHFDQLEALWNKRSPPRRKHNQKLSKQISLTSRLDSSDTEERTPGEENIETKLRKDI
ncbi:unnamed protein product [Timema podura]|uniref:Uncharacterized protein n=1 Tax=Timema podura TaxID=61482 RepID=A0ABN7NIT8_TIMPD|nr:unnamed protein product [Timema podura]